MADCMFRIYEVSFNILAASTLAFASMIVASEIRFWIAADCMFFCVSVGKMRSNYNSMFTLDEDVLDEESPRRDLPLDILLQLISHSVSVFKQLLEGVLAYH